VAIRLNNLALLFLVGEPFEFEGMVPGLLYCAGVKVCFTNDDKIGHPPQAV
jgi:hypothetical protein